MQDFAKTAALDMPMQKEDVQGKFRKSGTFCKNVHMLRQEAAYLANKTTGSYRKTHAHNCCGNSQKPTD